MVRGTAPPEPDALPPEDLRELDRLLRSIRFAPRPSLGREVLGRVRREAPDPGPGLAAGLELAAAAVVLGLLIFSLWATLVGIAG